ncbi:hypothetical protein MIC448_1630008 [Microbacterium sp. C448]|nr:hypothetical protein MIC448_1630008 [Microbacterium sp. C448]
MSRYSVRVADGEVVAGCGDRQAQQARELRELRVPWASVFGSVAPMPRDSAGETIGSATDAPRTTRRELSRKIPSPPERWHRGPGGASLRVNE